MSTSAHDVLAAARQLDARDQPYALVSVLRVQPPASARPEGWTDLSMAISCPSGSRSTARKARLKRSPPNVRAMGRGITSASATGPIR